MRDPVRDREVGLEYLRYVYTFLEESGATLDLVSVPSLNNSLVLAATLHGCYFQILPINPKGWDNEALLKSISEDGKVYYLSRLGMSERLAVFYTSIDLYVSYVLVNIGVSRAEPMVFAILPRGECDAVMQMDWSKLYQ